MSNPNSPSYASAVKSSTPKSLKTISISRATPDTKSTPKATSVSNHLKRKRELSSEDSGEAPSRAQQAKLQPADQIVGKVCSESVQASKEVKRFSKSTNPVKIYIAPGFESRSVQTDTAVSSRRIQSALRQQIADEKTKNVKLSDKFFAEVQKNEVLESTIAEIKNQAERSIDKSTHTKIDIEVTAKEKLRKSKSKSKYQPSKFLAPAYNLQTQTFIQLNCEISKARLLSESLASIVSICDNTVNKLTQRNVKNALDFHLKNLNYVCPDKVSNKSSNKSVKLNVFDKVTPPSRVQTRSSSRTPKTPAPKSVAPSKILGTDISCFKASKKTSQHKISLDEYLTNVSNPKSPKVAETSFPDPLIEISLASQESIELSRLVGKDDKTEEEKRLKKTEKSKKFVESESNPINFSLCNISQENSVEDEWASFQKHKASNESWAAWFTKPENRHLDPKAFHYSDDIVCPPKEVSLLNLSDSFILKSEDEDSLTDEKIRIWTRKVKEEPKDDSSNDQK